MVKIDKSFILVLLIVILFYVICFFLTGDGLPCLFHKITNFYCPGCGITRMFLSLFTLDIYQAFRYNPLLFILLIISTIYIIIKFFSVKLLKKEIRIPNYIIYILLVILLIYWIIRNIPWFNYLVPTIVN